MMREDFDRDGYVLVPNVLSTGEVAELLELIEKDARVAAHTRGAGDTDGRASRLSIWHDLPDDAFGALSRDARIAGVVAELLGEPVLHYHSKVMLKEPRQGGRWEWHQDYGYWYQGGFMWPRMASAMIVLDRATRENGCLKVLAGSHLLGRLDHGVVGAQQGADPSRIAALEDMLEVRYMEAEPGSVVFFHCNLLHASEANLSDHARRAYICCYSAASNASLRDPNALQPI